MNKKGEHQQFSCAYCTTIACEHDSKDKYPPACMYKTMEQALVDESLSIYNDDPAMKSLFQDTARIEKDFYCKFTRVEETIELIKRQNYRHIGIATCVGFLKEARLFCQLLKEREIKHSAVSCKIGAVDKEILGLDKKDKIRPDLEHESMCNPILQALCLNNLKTDFNVMMGLCVGHDAMFLKYVEAPTTVLAVKDRVLAHNPTAALYTIDSYYSRLKQKG